ncbi:DUF4138 domain-containing protein [candidate division KSB1 bacterium]|nr:DUF4138 domain-containing protein [candidate division KSB1 bacterium]NIR70509.1 DUF4138 domain-containing protein [candidate division KSB1 bacterium]NIS27684.1 DUF4138 domain-containing protein [candidate division KSB1 bacterium]NIT74519.1 DUF4138 domain-containing protein [candidate division KSB1 bacterium]NIU23758.1 DUF4138 domain-containing protein [candidate division KSB1 bacterium]
MNSIKIIVIGLSLFCCQLVTSQTNSSDIVMNLQIGTLSEIVIPEPYLTIQIPVKIMEMRDVPGRSKRVITVHPVISERTTTNIRVYTQHYDFNIKAFINHSNRRATQSLDLNEFTKHVKPWKNSTDDSSTNSTNGKYKPDNMDPTKNTWELELLKGMLKVKPDLLKPNKHAHAIVQNRVVFGIDYIFHYEEGIVFKATLWNKSKVPYHILNLTITYKEKSGVPLISERETKTLRLTPVYEKYSKKIVPQGEKSHIIYMTSKLSPQDTGFFNCVLIEKNGTRNFNFDIPSYIKD